MNLTKRNTFYSTHNDLWNSLLQDVIKAKCSEAFQIGLDIIWKMQTFRVWFDRIQTGFLLFFSQGERKKEKERKTLMPEREASARGRQELLLVANYLIIAASSRLLHAGDAPSAGLCRDSQLGDYKIISPSVTESLALFSTAIPASRGVSQAAQMSRGDGSAPPAHPSTHRGKILGSAWSPRPCWLRSAVSGGNQNNPSTSCFPPPRKRGISRYSHPNTLDSSPLHICPHTS